MVGFLAASQGNSVTFARSGGCKRQAERVFIIFPQPPAIILMRHSEKPMSKKIALVTDSTANFPKELLEKYQIHIAPLVLIWGDETFQDGVDIHPSEFYQRLKTAKVMPSTSQATPSSFYKIYSELLAQDYQILTITLASALSGTMDSAIQARAMLPDSEIEIFDSQTTAMALGYQVLQVARAIQDGANMQDCLALAERARQNSGVIFAVDTLEFLHRGGRIGSANRFLGTALNIKPILEVVNGRIEAVDKVRTRKKSLERLLDLLEDRIGGRTPVRLASLHANAPVEGQEILRQAAARFNSIENMFSEVSPVIGTHTGPGTIGLVYMAGM